jgi:hypothetical protein
MIHRYSMLCSAVATIGMLGAVSWATPAVAPQLDSGCRQPRRPT